MKLLSGAGRDFEVAPKQRWCMRNKYIEIVFIDSVYAGAKRSRCQARV